MASSGHSGETGRSWFMLFILILVQNPEIGETNSLIKQNGINSQMDLIVHPDPKYDTEIPFFYPILCISLILATMIGRLGKKEGRKEKARSYVNWYKALKIRKSNNSPNKDTNSCKSNSSRRKAAKHCKFNSSPYKASQSCKSNSSLCKDIGRFWWMLVVLILMEKAETGETRGLMNQDGINPQMVHPEPKYGTEIILYPALCIAVILVAVIRRLGRKEGRHEKARSYSNWYKALKIRKSNSSPCKNANICKHNSSRRKAAKRCKTNCSPHKASKSCKYNSSLCKDFGRFWWMILVLILVQNPEIVDTKTLM